MQNKEELKILVRGLYDIQKLRIQMGNRISANLREKVIPLECVVELQKHLNSLKKTEDAMIKDLAKLLKNFFIFTEYLKEVKGVGPKMASVIISEIDIRKAKYASSLWKYAGLDVAADGRGRSKKKEHLVEIAYTNSDGKAATRKGITFNPFLKSKLIGVLGPSFLKCKSMYSVIYYDYKLRLQNHPDHKDKSDGHRHNMAIRYMIKRFLVDLYVAWRELDDLEVYPEYARAKLGIVHG